MSGTLEERAMPGRREIPFSPPDITQEEIDEVVDTLKSGWITTGPKTKELERQLAGFASPALPLRPQRSSALCARSTSDRATR